MGFHPRTVAEDISEACRKEIYTIVHSINGWIETKHEAETPDEIADVVSTSIHSMTYLVYG